VTATATAPDGSASEFCGCKPLRPPEGVLVLSLDSITVTLDTAEDASYSIVLINTGTADLSWSAAKTAAWITEPAPVGGMVSAGGSDTVSLTLDASGLPAELGVTTADRSDRRLFRPAVPRPCELTLRVFDMRGKQIAPFTGKKFEPGWYLIAAGGRDLTPGVHFYRLSAREEQRIFERSGVMMLIQ
jgi:hypothetical protein